MDELVFLTGYQAAKKFNVTHQYIYELKDKGKLRQEELEVYVKYEGAYHKLKDQKFIIMKASDLPDQ